jgi:hypothetical protein
MQAHRRAWADVEMLSCDMRGTDATGDEMTDDVRIRALRYDEMWLERMKSKRSSKTRKIGPPSHIGARNWNTLASKLIKESTFLTQRQNRNVEATLPQAWNENGPLPFETTDPEPRTYEECPRPVLQERTSRQGSHATLA